MACAALGPLGCPNFDSVTGEAPGPDDGSTVPSSDAHGLVDSAPANPANDSMDSRPLLDATNPGDNDALLEAAAEATFADSEPETAPPYDAHGPESGPVPTGDGTIPLSGTISSLCVKVGVSTSSSSSSGSTTGPVCVKPPDLSGVGTGDFEISFDILTTQSGLVAVANQRATCGFGDFWDIRLSNGQVFVETDDGSNYNPLSGMGAPVNDGQTHHVFVQRASGTLSVSTDAKSAGYTKSLANFGALPPIRTSTDVCEGLD